MATPDLLAQGVLDLHRAVRGSPDMPAAVDCIVGIAVRVIEGCDLSSVTMVHGPDAATMGHQGDQAVLLDEVQYAGDDGPSLHACRSRETVLLPVIAADDRWPAFVAAAARNGVLASMSLPLVIDGDALGALNLYAHGSRRFTAPVQAAAASFAEQAAIAMANVLALLAAERTEGELRTALGTRDRIGQAKGILMERHHMTADAAFEVLRGVSQRRNIKLRDIAEELASTGETTDPPARRPSTA